MSDQATLLQHVNDLCDTARPAARALALLSNPERQAVLESIAVAIADNSNSILAANTLDLDAAAENNLTAAMIDRLRLDQARLDAIVADVRSVAGQDDPVGRTLEKRDISDGIALEKITVPIGVIAIIFESRPNVTIDAAVLCLRSGNACILRGGKEAVHSNRAFATAITQGLQQAGVDQHAVQLVQHQERELVPLLLKRDDAIDLVVPRGGEGLIRAVVSCSTIPVIKHDKGICSLYVHTDADIAMAIKLIINAKCQRPGVCNTIENLVIDEAIAEKLLPALEPELLGHNVEIRADKKAATILKTATATTDEDWDTEYLDLIISIKTVADINEAITFTNKHSSAHSDGIITTDQAAAELYLRAVDSSCVYHNASTRYTDGSQFGLGAEVGISTNRLHARGPMGVGELCTYKFVLRGNGQIRG